MTPHLLQMLHDTAGRHAERPAIVFGATRLTWAELRDEVDCLIRGLAALGIGAGDRVALVEPNTPAFVTSFLAVTGLGAVLVPLNPAYAPDELGYYLQHCAVRAAIAAAPQAATCRSLLGARGVVVATSDTPAGAVDFASLLRVHRTGDVPAATVARDAVYQYSSGSTGRPKRVARTHEQCWWEAVNFAATTGVGSEDRIFCTVPLFHTHGQGNCLLAAVHTGAALVLFPDPQPFILHRQRALEVLARERATVFPGVPFVFRLLADAGDADLSALRLCFSAGTALPPSTFESFQHRFGVPVRQLYGCTEAGALTINLDADPTPTAASVGHPLARVRVRVVDEARHPAATDQVGEVVISTPAMTAGYHQMEEHNREVFRDGFFYTGDLGRLDDAGRLWITGRKKLFIAVGGNKVDPVEVEDVLGTHTSVREAVVVGIPGKAAGEEVVKAVVVAASPVDRAELITHCRARLAGYKVPQVVEFRDEIPKSPLGKVLRKYLI